MSKIFKNVIADEFIKIYVCYETINNACFLIELFANKDLNLKILKS